MTLEIELQYLLRMGLAALLSAVVGYDRERCDRPAGLRTHMLVGLGSAMFVILGDILLHYFSDVPGTLNFDPVRILGAVVSGVAFLGAGTIFFARGENVVQGLTTAASLWATAGIGMAVGLEEYTLATGAAVIIVLILQSSRLLHAGTQERETDIRR